jgi:predicted CopG family antitoxin
MEIPTQATQLSDIIMKLVKKQLREEANRILENHIMTMREEVEDIVQDIIDNSTMSIIPDVDNQLYEVTIKCKVRDESDTPK